MGLAVGGELACQHVAVGPDQASQAFDPVRQRDRAGIGLRRLFVAQGVAAGVVILKPGKLGIQPFQEIDQSRLVQPAFAARQADAGKAGQPLLKLAVEAVLAVAGEQFQQPHDQRSGKAQKRAGKGRRHAAKLGFQPVHQLVKDLNPAFTLVGGQGPDGVHDGRHGRRKPIERTQQPKEDQQVRQIARDVARLVDAGRDRFQDRTRGFGRDRPPDRPPRAQKRRQGRQQARRGVGRGLIHRAIAQTACGKAFDPADRVDQLRHLPEAGQHPQRKDQQDRPVEQRVGGKDRQDLAIGEPTPRPHQRQHDQHQHDLPHRLREMRIAGFASRAARGPHRAQPFGPALPWGAAFRRVAGHFRIWSGQSGPRSWRSGPSVRAGSDDASR